MSRTTRIQRGMHVERPKLRVQSMRKVGGQCFVRVEGMQDEIALDGATLSDGAIRKAIRRVGMQQLRSTHRRD